MLFASVLALASPPALSQSYPSKLVRIVVTGNAGSPIDLFARFVADQMRERFDQPFVVEGRPGAGGAIGMEVVVKSQPDGHTLLAALDAHLVVSPSVYANFAVNPLRDLAPVAVLGDAIVVVLVANAGMPVQTLAEFVNYARARPGALSYASGGHGTYSNIVAELFLRQAQLEVLHVPYNRPPAAVANEVVSQRVAIYMALPPTVQQYIRAGTLRALAVAGSKRSPLLPEVPTFAEAGYPAFAPPPQSFMVLAPAHTPADVVEALNAEIQRISAMPKMRELLAAQGAVPGALSVAEATARLRRDTDFWSGVVKALGIKAQ